MPVDRHIVYESENIRLIAQEQGGDDVVVSFNHMGLVCNEDQFGGTVFSKARESPPSVS